MISLSMALSLVASSASFRPHVQSNEAIISALVQNFEPSEVPVFYQIFSCESAAYRDGPPRQWDSDGLVVTHANKNGSLDYGIAQINSTHLKEANDMGLDIFNSMDDNIKFAAWLYSHQDYGAWQTCSKRAGVL